LGYSAIKRVAGDFDPGATTGFNRNSDSQIPRAGLERIRAGCMMARRLPERAGL
jgi:hypothetical protein